MKLSRRAHLIFALIALALPARGDEAAPSVTAFNGDFERGDFSGWDREAARTDTIQIVTASVRAGRYAAKFTVRAGERTNNGNRAEIAYDNGDQAGREVWYAWSFLIPRDFPDIEWKPDLWQCLGQWHDQPDAARGETWDTFPGRSPSLAVYYTVKKGVPAFEIWSGTYGKTRIKKLSPLRRSAKASGSV